ncbi:MAG: LEA type 2 family protein [Treponema sp.]|jgi:LEA14-like dessication related protein|nr:LEA type 2 family protein [Treponema sp.]
MWKNMPLFLLCLLIPLGCKTPPAPGGNVPSALVFDHITAKSVDFVEIHYRITTENSRSLPLELEFKGYSGLLNGIPIGKASVLENLKPALTIAPGSSLEHNVVLRLNLRELPNSAPARPESENRVDLTLNVNWRYGGGPPAIGNITAQARFPAVREPEFTITSIAILQAELINTRFRVSLRIDNPNVFPVSLSSFAYDLYGENYFWAGGSERDVLHIPAQGFAETKLFLMMNVINMPRRLLDDVIAMNTVNYRFTGSANVSTGVPWLPEFRMQFDKTGASEVLK